jgi:phosphoserine/homoserine phosphotransferase
MVQLGMPTVFCHRLVVADDRIVDYRLRQPDQKRHAVLAFQRLNYKVIAAGDSYNDTSMLSTAERGVLFRSPANVQAEFPQFTAVHEYDDLLSIILDELQGA